MFFGWDCKHGDARRPRGEGTVMRHKATQASPVQACSACAGDYEDPEHTAGSEEDDADEPQERGGHVATSDEFPEPSD
jgi:hypothetical protein